MAQQSGPGGRDIFNERNVRIATILGLPVAVISLLVGLSTCSASGGTQANPTPTTSAPTVLPPPTTDPPLTEEPTPTFTDEPTGTETPTETPPPTTHFIGDEDYLDYNAKSSTGEWEFGSYEISSKSGTQTYGHSVLMNPGCQNRDGGDFWLDFKIGGGFTRLKGTVGPSIMSPADSRFKYAIFADNVPLVSGTVTSSTPAKIDVPVTSRSRLRLFMSDPQAPNRSCGFSKPYRLIWGDLQLSGAI